MTRRLRMGIGLVVLSTGVGSLLAQDQAPAYEERPLLNRQERARTVPTDSLIYQRAVVLARNRTARMEQRKWEGISAQRPGMRPSIYGNDLNPIAYGGCGWGYRPFVLP